MKYLAGGWIYTTYPDGTITIRNQARGILRKSKLYVCKEYRENKDRLYIMNDGSKRRVKPNGDVITTYPLGEFITTH